MSPFWRGAAVLGAVALVFGAPRWAHAQAAAGERPIRVQYTAHEGCPDALGFFWYIRARTQRVRLAAPGEPADLALVQIERAGEKSVGTLQLPPVEGRAFSRQVEAASCNDVVLALSLVLALNYDPDATTTFPTEVTAPPESAPVAPALPPVVALPAPQQPPRPLPEVPHHPGEYGASAGVSAFAYGGIAPGLHAVLSPFFEYGSNARRLFQPRLRAAFLVQVPAADVGTTLGNATLLFLAGQLSGCPLSIALNGDVAIAPCLAVDVGQILGRANAGVQGGQSGSLWWVALEGTVRLRSALGGPLFAEVTGGGGLTLAPGRFALNGGAVEVSKLPTAFGSFGLALGVHFP